MIVPSIPELSNIDFNVCLTNCSSLLCDHTDNEEGKITGHDRDVVVTKMITSIVDPSPTHLVDVLWAHNLSRATVKKSATLLSCRLIGFELFARDYKLLSAPALNLNSNFPIEANVCTTQTAPSAFFTRLHRRSISNFIELSSTKDVAVFINLTRVQLFIQIFCDWH